MATQFVDGHRYHKQEWRAMVRFFQGLERAGREISSVVLSTFFPIQKISLPDLRQAFDRGEIKMIADEYTNDWLPSEAYLSMLKAIKASKGDVAAVKRRHPAAVLLGRRDRASIAREHGDTYVDGIQPVFDALKARHFDSFWNWVRQDAILMFYDILFGRLTTVDREITARCIAIMNRADSDLIKFMEFMVNCCDPSKGETYAIARKLGHELLENCRGVVGQPPLYKDGKCLIRNVHLEFLAIS